MTRLDWKKRTMGGWTALSGKTRYTVAPYRRGDTGFCYVLRINTSAESSPAVPYRTAAEAMARAVALAAVTR